MLLAKEDGAAGEIHEGGAKGAGKTPAFGAHQVDVRRAVDLRAAEEEVIDAPLAREIEELARAFAERVAFALVQTRDAQRPALRAQELACGRGNRRGGADRDLRGIGDQPRDQAGKELLRLCHTNSAR